MAALNCLLDEAYQEYLTNTPDLEILPMNEWKAERRSKHPQFMYWDIVMQMELILCIFVRSIRIGHFKLYIESLQAMMPWVFALDHGHYARWMPVHIHDMLKLENLHPDIFRQYMNGNFTVQKSKRKFSLIGMDQNHEQLNKDIKGDGGVSSLMGDNDALVKWMVAGPEVSSLVNQFEQSLQQEKTSSQHHEENISRQTKFHQDVIAMVKTINEMDNPFMDNSTDLSRLDSKDIVSEQTVEAIKNARNIGKKQFEKFWTERISGDKPLLDKLSRNNLSLFRNSMNKSTRKSKTQKEVLKKDCNLLSRLYIGSTLREGDLENFFKHENQQVPPSLSNYGDIRHTTKSDLTTCIENELETTHQVDTFKSASCKILDGAAIVNIRAPRDSITFEDYAEKEFLPFLK